MSESSVESELLIVGASVRAATMSAVRGGLSVVAVDLFADQDLRSIADECHQITNYPDDITGLCLSIREGRPHIPWMYTGAIENFPELVNQLEQSGLLMGVGADALRRVRDPLQLSEVFRRHDIPFPITTRTNPESDSESLSSVWLIKAERSAGGQRVELAAGATDLSDGDYFQEFVKGDVCSAAFVANSSECKVLGVSDMLVGSEWLGCSGFTYCGSIVRHASGSEISKWRNIGNVVHREFGLVGVFGVDAIMNDGRLTPIEVNPRYTASMELFEQPNQPSIVQQHLRACDAEVLTAADVAAAEEVLTAADVAAAEEVLTTPSLTSLHVGKAILFAKKPCNFPSRVETLLQGLSKTNLLNIQLADLPSAGPIESGHPILSILVKADSHKALIERIQSTAANIYAQLDE